MSTNKYYGRRRRSSPLLPEGVDIIVESPPFEACSIMDKFLVYASSIIVVGSPIWFYGGIIYLFRKWRHYRELATAASAKTNNTTTSSNNYATSSGESSQESSKKQPPLSQEEIQQSSLDYEKYQRLAKRYCVALITVIVLSVWGPHRSRKVGEFLGVRKWRLWDAWLNYVGYTVLHDKGIEGQASESRTPRMNNPQVVDNDNDAILAFVPHGIFPFALAFSCLPQRGYEETWGVFRPVVATATKLFPLVRTFIAWMGGIDASRSAVSSALNLSDAVGIAPGGIAEMFETYPKSGFHRNDEAFRVRNGIFKLALKHNRPIVPIYCFGATKMLRRVQLPAFIENLSRILKISLCLFFGKLGLPIPFRQRLMYVMGKTIYPPLDIESGELDEQAQEMHHRFCDEIMRIFENNKDHYGWGNKSIRLV
eukprot:CAMPEP_0113423902 /NCGR_PEP_ID=MMETSP0013_2-20120614/29294_1 /TAXON_ID=2843 ORGANISM="Skeletonema costatum, Strain 1716" /NCGR_SAMPLE_ID=MMETSP0013_2 /ASSEMBLY_ACC=CAM_ASM_000158 /LENGTH=423 /DNA_ID=CAMNT_0000311849 /DNA_START=109 /DNA_END=1380 /DNA_ORIENTATION=- /assembly_acc=CAM_ASM_000158